MEILILVCWIEICFGLIEEEEKDKEENIIALWSTDQWEAEEGINTTTGGSLHVVTNIWHKI